MQSLITELFGSNLILILPPPHLHLRVPSHINPLTSSQCNLHDSLSPPAIVSRRHHGLLPQGAYDYNEDSYADYTLVNVDGWSYAFRTLPKEKSDDPTQYLMAMSIRDYPDVIFRGIKLGDAYEDVIKKFPSGKEEGQIPGATDSYFSLDYRFASNRTM